MGKLIAISSQIEWNYLIITNFKLLRGVMKMGIGFNMNRINPNQTQVFFEDGRYETLTDAELEIFLSEASLSEREESTGQDLLN